MMCGIVFHSCVVHSELKVHDAMPSFNNKWDGYFAEVYYTLYGLPFYYIFLRAFLYLAIFITKWETAHVIAVCCFILAEKA